VQVTEMRSREDRSVHLLHFIVHVIHNEFPELADFYDQLNIDVDKTGWLNRSLGRRRLFLI